MRLDHRATLLWAYLLTCFRSQGLHFYSSFVVTVAVKFIDCSDLTLNLVACNRFFSRLNVVYKKLSFRIRKFEFLRRVISSVFTLTCQSFSQNVSSFCCLLLYIFERPSLWYQSIKFSAPRMLVFLRVSVSLCIWAGAALF